MMIYEDVIHEQDEQEDILSEAVGQFFQQTHGDRVCSFDLIQEKLKDEQQVPQQQE